MSTDLFRYSSRPGHSVSVRLAEGAEEACELRVGGDITTSRGEPATTTSVPDAKVPEVARGILAAMHEAAGLPVPIVLDRVGGDKFSHWFELGRSTLGPSVLLDPHAALSFRAAREFAAALVAAVERAESEPDPAEVEALAKVLRHSRQLATPTHHRLGAAGRPRHPRPLHPHREEAMSAPVSAPSRARAASGTGGGPCSGSSPGAAAAAGTCVTPVRTSAMADRPVPGLVIDRDPGPRESWAVVHAPSRSALVLDLAGPATAELAAEDLGGLPGVDWTQSRPEGRGRGGPAAVRGARC